MRHSTGYILWFAVAVCLVCSILVCTARVALSARQEENALLYKQKNVLLAAGLASPGERLAIAQIGERFATVHPSVVEMRTGKVIDNVDPRDVDPKTVPTYPAPANPAQVMAIPERIVVFTVLKDDKPDMVVLPVEGKGLWSTLYGFLCLDVKTFEIRGITFYQHGETPGLGGEIENPKWQALWKGRQAFDADLNPIIKVVKGAASAPNEVDGLSGATLTSRGVTNLAQFWLGRNGFGPYLRNLREQTGALRAD